MTTLRSRVKELEAKVASLQESQLAAYSHFRDELAKLSQEKRECRAMLQLVANAEPKSGVLLVYQRQAKKFIERTGG